MKRITTILIVFVLGFSSTNIDAQISVSGGSGLAATYTSFTLAGGLFAAINGTAQTGNNIIVTVTADIATETGATSLNQGAWTSITISPSGARTVSGAPAGGTPLFNFNSADNVTINGLNSGGNSLIIANTTASGTAGTCAIRFINDATNNTLSNCTLKASGTSTSNGVIFFSTTTGATGNDNNTITSCSITANGASLPAIGIYSAGTAAKTNDNITVSNCSIFDFFKAGGTSSGITVSSNSSTWTISGNSFYETATRDGTFRMIQILTGSGYTVSSNYLGGSSASAVGTFTVSGATAAEMIPIYLSVSTAATSTVSSNTITNISFTEKTDGNEFFSGIWVAQGTVNVTSNTIGDNATGAINLSIVAVGATAYIDCIQYYGTISGTAGVVSNNTIGSITIGGTFASPNARYFNGITYITSAALTSALTISGNTIGNAATANSIQTTTTSPITAVSGIYTATTGSGITLSGNTVANLTDVGTSNNTGDHMYGVASFDAGASVTISGNSVHDLTTATQNSTLSFAGEFWAFNGVAAGGATGGQSPPNTTISGNTIYNMKLSSLAVTPLTDGIYFPPANSGANSASGNLIYNIQSDADGTIISGIEVTNPSTGTANVYNNMIRLGYKTDGTSSTFATLYAGIYINVATAGATCNIYYNTIYIGGTGVSATANNTAAIDRISACTLVMKDNIFENTRANAAGGGKHYGVITNTTTTVTSNYNLIYASTAANQGSYDAGTTPRTFAAWQGTMGDANSIGNADAILTSPTSTTPDLHLDVTSPANDVGTPIAGITTDYDADIRSVTIPDIGADEYVAPLPIELLSFNAIINGDRVDLTWETATEINNDYFTVEKSKEGQTYEEVLRVKGAGNSTQTINYLDFDSKPFIGISYYRLKQTDFDGRETTSNIVPVEYNPNGDPNIALFPNPSDGSNTTLVLNEFQGEEVLVVLRDIAGKELYSKIIVTSSNNELVALDPSNKLAPGSYLVTATSNNKLYSKHLIVK